MTHLSIRIVYVLSAWTSLAGCGGKASDDAPAADTGSTSDTGTTNDTGGGGDAGDTALSDVAAETETPPGSCTTTSLGTAVTVEALAEDPPILPGGVVRDGTYSLVAAYDYVGKSGAPGKKGMMKRTAKFTAGALEAVRQDGDGPLETYAGTYRVVGTAWEQTLTCPSMSFAKGAFEATTDTFKIFVGSGTPSVARLVVMKRM